MGDTSVTLGWPELIAQLISSLYIPKSHTDTPKFSGCWVLKNNFLTLNIENYIYFPKVTHYPQFEPKVRVPKNCFPVASLLVVFPEARPGQAQVLCRQLESGRPWVWNVGVTQAVPWGCEPLLSPLLGPRLIAALWRVAHFYCAGSGGGSKKYFLNREMRNHQDDKPILPSYKED